MQNSTSHPFSSSYMECKFLKEIFPLALNGWICPMRLITSVYRCLELGDAIPLVLLCMAVNEKSGLLENGIFTARRDSYHSKINGDNMSKPADAIYKDGSSLNFRGEGKLISKSVEFFFL
ncbi:uncharacterized protein LOC114580300 isoform X3 [Dendrobium catenatum]|uniref:uncharacterized protein LOC114580300 isoform X3 n=1 Tax=Dendrobium catenatum TaxID=906689 RepID=UPI00109F226D|nr:uncharacterized protein LOC114580300 isoform X3 [Dendrobium catenatum]